ncbi:MAG: phenylalanine--tRNA ligase subunit beta [Spirochaetae bacterium HGW-Spirochaetae-1]|nr:MAG: phenylalanine--tRNA ligase subunit beta [Spirochaetae bacterium HGW-Spirochaetae-1]
MWLSWNIISKMVNLDGVDPGELALKITMSTAEIDSIEYMNQHLKTIITAKILDVKPHPNADKLTLVDLEAGGENLRVVCGAPNHKKGDIVPLATVGTKFNEEFTVKKSKIRGEESSGMLCSEKEMGLSDDHSGIMILPENTKTGVAMSELYGEWVDIRFEIDNKSITHRPDLWSHVGFAREIGALLGRPVKDPVDHSLAKTFKNTADLKVTIKDPEACPRYSGLAVKNIKIGPSPEWLKAMVTSIGMRPINNIVDVTNYVMAELGEPMHAFDRKKLRGNEIIVRLAGKNETIMTLDGKEHALFEDDIVIADTGVPIALAGVMGGGNSEIEDGTTEIVLEAANFSPVLIRKTAQKHNNRTEAAIRFEKSLSPEITPSALIRCYDLIKQCLPEAEAMTEIIDAYPVPQKTVTIEMTMDYIREKLGNDIADARIMEILTSLAFQVKQDGASLSIIVPPYRATKDVSIPADIVEEVGRIYGYDNIIAKAPYVPCSPPAVNGIRTFERKVKQILSRDFSMTETSGYSFVGEDILNKLGINEDRELRLQNPLSREHDRLNRSLIPNAVKNIDVNQRYHETCITYEMGRVYIKDDRKSPDLIKERTKIAGVIYARKTAEPLFYQAKSTVTGLLDMLAVKNAVLSPQSENLPPYAHPGRSMSVTVDGEPMGLIFELHPRKARALEISGTAALFDLDITALYGAEKSVPVFSELQKYPEVPFEISVIADSMVYAGDIAKIIANANRQYIKRTDVLTIYEGTQIEKGKKSISFRIILAAPDRTLEPAEIDKMQKKIIGDLKAKGFPLR